ncbi:MAG: hypothetical protein HY924_08325 [Elusimicrobia bacterium]|nr:hypothetical protein [Elusimicrobiota bacterium]
MTAPSAGYDVAAVVPSDYAALAGFLAGFPGLGAPAEFWLGRFRLWWDENPAFRPEAARGWMLRRRGALCGFLSNAPGLMWAQGKPLRVFSVSTWMVLPEHRHASLDLLLKQMEEAKATLLFDTTPTEHVAAVLENLGFENIPWGEDKESVALLRPDLCLKARFGAPSLVPDAAWRAGGWLLDRVQGLRLRRGRAGAGLKVELAREAGPAFDRLWERTKARHRLTNVRTSSVLRWHCFADRDVEKRLFACRAGEEVAGYLIAKANTRRGLKALEVVDYWADSDADGVFEALLDGVLEHAAGAGFALASFGHFTPSFESSLRAAGLWEVPLTARRNLVLAGPGAPVRAAEEGAYFTGLQGDYGTSP